MSSLNKHLQSMNAAKLLNPIVEERTGTEIILEERPFMCAVCTKTFKQKAGVKKHIVYNKHILHIPNKAIPEKLGIILPKNWKYGDYKFGVNGSSLTFLTYNIHTKEDAVMWLKLYMEENKSKFVSACSHTLKDGKYLRYVCEHWKDGNRKHKNKIKGTGCKCAITFNLSRNMAKITISSLLHNHSLTSAAIISFFTPTENVKQIFLEMFNNGAGPSEALKQYKNHIKSQNLSGAEYLEFSANKSKMPSYNWAYYVYQTQFKNKYGSQK